MSLAVPAIPCGQEHTYFDPMHAVVLADLVGQVAAGHVVDIRVPRSKTRVNHHLVTAHDAAEWNAHSTTTEPVDDDQSDEFTHLDPSYRCDTRTSATLPTRRQVDASTRPPRSTAASPGP